MQNIPDLASEVVSEPKNSVQPYTKPALSFSPVLSYGETSKTSLVDVSGTDMTTGGGTTGGGSVGAEQTPILP